MWITSLAAALGVAMSMAPPARAASIDIAARPNARRPVFSVRKNISSSPSSSPVSPPGSVQRRVACPWLFGLHDLIGFRLQAARHDHRLELRPFRLGGHLVDE